MKYIVFGAGDTGKAAIEVLGKENIAFFIDNDEGKQRIGFEGFKVCSLSEALIEKEYQIVIAVMPRYEGEIIDQLNKAGITEFIRANNLINDERKRKIKERVDHIAIYERCIGWIKANSINDNRGICVSSTEKILYPEVTGYYIPSLLRWGYRDMAISFAKNLMEIQRADGAWNGPHDDTPYVFDTGQILKGLIAVSPILPEAINSAVKGADWLISTMSEDGRLITPDVKEWGEDESVCSDLIHIYCLSPLIELSSIVKNEKYKNAAERVLNYYLDNYYERIVGFSHLSHFQAYLIEALIDVGRGDIARIAIENMKKYQRKNGAIPAYNDCEWVCSTGLFQLSLVCFRLGDLESGNRMFSYACRLQNESGGWFGSYLSEEDEKESNSYFPLSEISWANKYFLDALYEKNKTEFDKYAPSFLDKIEKNDGRYGVIKHIVSQYGGGVVADVGCGKGRYIKNLREDYPDIRIIGIDISDKVLSYVEIKNISLKVGSLTSLPLEDEEVDAVYACESLEHAIDIESSIREMCRVTKKGGKVIIIDKNMDNLGQFDISEWEQWFDKNQLRQMMLKYCSEVSIIDSIDYEDCMSDGLFCAWIGTVKK